MRETDYEAMTGPLWTIGAERRCGEAPRAHSGIPGNQWVKTGPVGRGYLEDDEGRDLGR